MSQLKRSNSPVTLGYHKPNQSWILALTGGEFKRAIMRKFNELWNNSGIKVMHRWRYFAKNTDIPENPNQNPGAEELNKRDGECIRELWKYSRPYN